MRNLLCAAAVALGAVACGAPDASVTDTEEGVKQLKCNDPSLHYVGHSKQDCQVIRFLCPVNTTYFSNHCGCGCQDLPACTAQECGPAPLAPIKLCADGVNYSGPGPCERQADGTCGYTWMTCPCPIIDCAAPPAGCTYVNPTVVNGCTTSCGTLSCSGTL
jgi:hypothetical protein